MPEPNLTPDERFILTFYKSGKPGLNWVVWSLHGAMISLFAWGAYRDDLATMATAFTCVILFRMYESSHQPRYFRVTRSLIEKYEAMATSHLNREDVDNDS